MKTDIEILNIVRDLFPYNYSVVGDESIQASGQYLKYLDFKISTYRSGDEINGWKLPMGWRVKKALLKAGNFEYDCIGESILGCAYLSTSYKGVVKKDELIKHCTYREDLEEAIVYDWTRLYRQGKKDWGLSLPWNVLNRLPDSDVEIDIETEQYESEMQVYEYLIKGSSEEEIIISGHNCHPYQANDDISGCAVGISIMNKLNSIKNLHYSYRLLIGPELFGPMQWLKRNIKNIDKIKGCILLKSVGNENTITMQKSYLGNTMLDKAGMMAMKEEEASRIFGFREYYGNDETVFDAYGIEIPTITFTRYPFREYHTNLDTPDIIKEEMLKNTEDIVMNTIEMMETNKKAKYIKEGLFCLSNPKYNLYRSAPEPGISQKGQSDVERRWNLMMNCLQRDLGLDMTAIDISIKYDLPYKQVIDYLEEWDERELIKLGRLES
jgi:aminopeptidase-like protein